MIRARTGSRGKNDVMRRSNSVEHLEQNFPDINEAVEEEERVVELGSHSATSSPVLPRRRPQRGGAEGDLPVLDHRGFHLGTLPRTRKLPVAPPPKTRHVYATVSKNEEAAAKGAPPTTLPKPKKGGGRSIASESNLIRDTKSRPEAASANFDIPMLEVVEPLEMAVSLPNTVDSGSPDDVVMTDANATDKPRDEDTISLQGLPSSEIPHQRAEDGHIYAVVDKKSKKKKKKKTEPTEESQDGACETAPIALDLSTGDGLPPKSPTKKPPAKPPRMRPPKPAPYVPRVGSPIPAILAAAAAECSSPLPPLSPRNCSPPTIPDRLPMKSVEEPHSPLPPSSPRVASPFPPGMSILKVELVGKVQVAFAHVYACTLHQGFALQCLCVSYWLFLPQK